MATAAATATTIDLSNPGDDATTVSTKQGASRRDRRRKATVNALTQATRDLVAHEGIGVSVQAIADRADVALTTLYNHFDSKDALLQATAIESLFEFEADVNRRMAGVTDPSERVCVRTRLYLRMAQTHRTTALFMSRLTPEVTATPELNSDLAAREVLEAERLGQLSGVEIPVAHLIVNATASRFIARSLQSGDNLETDADALARALMAVLGMPKPTISRWMRKALPPLAD